MTQQFLYSVRNESIHWYADTLMVDEWNIRCMYVYDKLSCKQCHYACMFPLEVSKQCG